MSSVGPATIGPYRVTGVLARGGMATIYAAFQPDLDRLVAIKVLLPELAADQACRALFMHEARLTARLQHPRIVVVHEAGEQDGLPYFVMAYVQGPTLFAAIHQGSAAPHLFSPVEARALLKPLAAALDYAHERGVVHRDLKPENIVLGTHGPVITDFGCACALDEASAAGRPLFGTPEYMGPGQLAGAAPDRRDDVYALGVMLYELLTGRPPFAGSSVAQVAAAQSAGSAPRLGQINPALRDLPRLEAVALKAIAADPAQRFASAGRFALALTGALRASAPRPSPAPRSASQPDLPAWLLRARDLVPGR